MNYQVTPWVLAVVLLLSGCTLFEPDEEGQDEVREAMLETLQQRRATWQEQNVSDYMWAYTTVDTRESVAPQEVTVEVRDGEVVEVEVNSGYTEPGPLADYLTVAEAFELVERALEEKADQVRVAYAEGNELAEGIPTYFEIDYDVRANGDEQVVQVGAFEVAAGE